MLPEQVWNMPRLGTFNLHASLLPNYRGAAPIHWVIINGRIIRPFNEKRGQISRKNHPSDYRGSYSSPSPNRIHRITHCPEINKRDRPGPLVKRRKKYRQPDPRHESFSGCSYSFPRKTLQNFFRSFSSGNHSWFGNRGMGYGSKNVLTSWLRWWIYRNFDLANGGQKENGYRWF